MNPWEAFQAANPRGSVVKGEVRNITEFGLFIGLENEIDGMVHLSDLDWSTPGDQAIAKYKKGDVVEAKVLDVDIDKERISLGVKQLASDPIGSGGAAEGGEPGMRRGETVTTTVTEVASGGIEVAFGPGNALKSFVRKSDLSRDRAEQRPERFAVGDKIDAMITNIDRATRKVSLSIKALEIDEEKKAVAEFGSTDSGASLGDILGAALREQEEERN
jgi:small subunit ribosomal protein S1